MFGLVDHLLLLLTLLHMISTESQFKHVGNLVNLLLTCHEDQHITIW